MKVGNTRKWVRDTNRMVIGSCHTDCRSNWAVCRAWYGTGGPKAAVWWLEHIMQPIRKNMPIDTRSTITKSSIGPNGLNERKRERKKYPDKSERRISLTQAHTSKQKIGKKKKIDRYIKENNINTIYRLQKDHNVVNENPQVRCTGLHHLVQCTALVTRGNRRLAASHYWHVRRDRLYITLGDRGWT